MNEIYDYSSEESRVKTAEFLFEYARSYRLEEDEKWSLFYDYYNGRHRTQMEIAESCRDAGIPWIPAMSSDPFLQVETQISAAIPSFEFRGRDSDMDSLRAKQREFVTRYILDRNGILLVSPELEGKAREICGPQAKMSPQLNPDNANNAANPVCGMQYMVVGGGDAGFTAKQWAVADASLLRECARVIYISRPTVIHAALDNPLIARIVPYVDFGVGWTDARPIIFSNPS